MTCMAFISAPSSVSCLGQRRSFSTRRVRKHRPSETSMMLEAGPRSFGGLNTPDDERGSLFLKHNWAPVKEQHLLHEISPLKQIGSLPPDFPTGMYLRIGPNPLTTPDDDKPYGWFDGSGMVHSVRFQPPFRKDSADKADINTLNAYYSNRWISTGFIRIAELLEKPPINITVQKGIFGLFAVLRLIFRTWRFSASEYVYGFMGILGTANTALSYFPVWDEKKKETRRSIIALYDSDSGYELDLSKGGLPILENICHTRTYNPYQLDHPMSPHPRYDPVTEEMISFGVGMDFKRLWRAATPVFFTNAQGKIYRKVDVITSKAVYQHDFVITKNFAIFLDSPSTIDPLRMLFHPVHGTTIGWEGDRSTKFVLLPRTTELQSEISEGAALLHGKEKSNLVDKTKAFALPKEDTCFVFHWANAWEETYEDKTKIVMYGSHYKSLEINEFNSEFPPPAEKLPTLYRFDIEITNQTASAREGKASKQRIFGSPENKGLVHSLPSNILGVDDPNAKKQASVDNLVIDFCNVSELKSGQKSKYIYMSYNRPLDSQENLMTEENPDEGWSLGGWEGVLKLDTETFEVKAIAYPPGTNGGEVKFIPKSNPKAEDDGWLISHVTKLIPLAEPKGDKKAEVSLFTKLDLIHEEVNPLKTKSFFCHCTSLVVQILRVGNGCSANE